ncbi:MAG: type II secretory pathway, component PulD [Verrucomicrobiota bacterium]
MNKYLTAHIRLIAFATAILIGTAALISPKVVFGQNASEKIRLMAETLRARDSGNLAQAKSSAEELIKIAPDDENVQRLLAAINADLERSGAGSAVYGRASSVPIESVVDTTLTSQAEQLMAEATEPAEANEEIEEVADEGDPYALPIAEISPEYVATTAIVEDLLIRGRAQFLNEDYDGAAATFKEIEARDPNNKEAKLFSTRIAEFVGKIQRQNLYKTREQMLTEVDQQWERPKVYAVDDGGGGGEGPDPGLQDKMESIIIPQVNFSGMELTRVIETLSELSVEYDPTRVGVNIIPLFSESQGNPRVNISLRNLSLDRILEFVTQQVNYAFDIGEDAVTVSPDGGGDSVSTITEFFPLSRATVIRLTGVRGSTGASSAPVNPFADPTPSIDAGPSADEETELLQAFFQRAGVNFELPGATLAFDGEQLIVTQTRRNLERMRTILRNYSEVKQVEIEAKFLEVSQNDLEEVGFDWNVTQGGDSIFTFSPRSINDAFSVNAESSQISIDSPDTSIGTGNFAFVDTDGDGISDTFAEGVITQEGLDRNVPFLPPSIPRTIDIASEVTSSLVQDGFNVGRYDVDFAIRALSRKTGSDLMSAPKVTVLSGKRANITVAQELRYPESYGDIESTVSSSNNAGGSAISVTAGTPEDFTTRNVGVELAVTPNVENDDTISLILEPRVTEFEGFVEYGGPSVALTNETTVTVPAGFYQPVFSTREISTEVTIFDGATIVMGGLTRDEIRSINDRVPVLGDIPGIGRLFRSEGETRQKRNLLIFVTANLVSPGGSPARQNYRSVKANSLFQNPTILTPSGTANRTIPPTDGE